ncbi:Mobile element protein [Richelia intracellularis]|nr:Mobile element protein [Richelia intracellularis]
MDEETLSATDTVKADKNLSQVEQAFRSYKTVDLKVRPISHSHYTAERVKAHIFLCMLSYYVEWHMRELLAPILFDEDDWEAAAARKESVVSPAKKSEKAKKKANKKRTSENLPVHGFQTLLDDLATIVKNTISTTIASKSFVFEKIT